MDKYTCFLKARYLAEDLLKWHVAGSTSAIAKRLEADSDSSVDANYEPQVHRFFAELAAALGYEVACK